MPKYLTSAASEAIELAKSVGLILDLWQEETLADSLGELPNGKWAASEIGIIVPRQNGKGVIIEARELAGLFLFGERTILHSAHEFKTAQEAFRRILHWIDASDDLRKRVKKVINSHGDEGIELRTGARLRFVARSKGSGRGFSGNTIILDEALALTAAHMAALMPTLSANPNPQIWYTSTPPLEPAAFLVSLRAKAETNARKLAYFEWSPPLDFAPTPKAYPLTDADRRMWEVCNPALGIRIDSDFVEMERSTLPDYEFGRERLGIWPPSAEGKWKVISEQGWLRALDPASKVGDSLSLSVAVSRDRTRGVIAIAGRRDDDLIHVEIVKVENGTGWMVGYIRKFVEKWKPSPIVIDMAHPEGSLIAELESAGLEITKPSVRQVSHAAGAFYDAVEGIGESLILRHIGQPELTVALADAGKRPLGESWTWESVSESVDISPLRAATLAFWGMQFSRIETPPEPMVVWL